ncbi:Uncharacterised protein [Sphingobacterium multivorum]|uniref:Uncharacterized protein n=1 Tax=Sphingobacterium multivorum TaxID=28454 RepID=A0A2X2IZI6_SPHMU|nr:Uncharacterised protein [Sphingobacterium multivorum]SUJ28723.1 Uncharacterised protein [Sphingobacterium multivorum]
MDIAHYADRSLDNGLSLKNKFRYPMRVSA